MASSEERRDEPVKEMVHKTKVIQFLGRTTPIVLQNDNGPCPLLAICNVLLLKNNLNLSPDIPEVSQEKLLSLVAERLIDSNSNVNNKDAEYVENQQQNIADAIDLLPRLATGIDVNLKFRRIDDFEFTRECAIFDLLDIPLYHGWIVDPQDQDTECAIGSKSYNTLMGELVALETQNMEGENKKNSEDDCIDFAAATAAALGVPSPCLSRGISFDDSPRSVSNDRKERKGDLEEEVELFRVLKLSEVELPNSVEKSEPAVLVKTLEGHAGDGSETNHQQKPSMSADTISSSNFNIDVESQMSHQKETPLSSDCNSLNNYSNDLITFETIQREDACSSSKTDHGNQVDLAISENSVEHVICKDVVEKISVDVLDPHSQNLSTSKAETSGAVDNQNGCATTEISGLPAPNLDLYSGIRQQKDVPEAYRSSVDGSEPMYEGEERILDSGPTMYEDREPMYEGEVVLAKQEDESATDPCGLSSKGDITPEQGELIKNFLKNNASQLSINGLFCLRDGLKERELCVFFRNNHFNTMFKFDGELYLLATDQGYINQPDLVWEKLNEVNGDTVFMTGNFKEFKVDNHDNTTWDEQNAMASTADYLASIDNSERAESNFNSDLQLAIALQQQEFEQQPQPQPQPQPPPQRNPQQPIVSGSSRLVTGPQVSRYSGRNSTTSSRQEAKSKEKCIVM